MKTYEIITPISTKPGKPVKMDGTIELDAAEGDALVALGALRDLPQEKPAKPQEPAVVGKAA